MKAPIAVIETGHGKISSLPENRLSIRYTEPEDLPRVMEIYAAARQFMADHGNPMQWGPTCWPPEELVRRDIRERKSYVCIDENDAVAAVFFYDYGKNAEPGYLDITEGHWLNDEPYGVVHRIAVDSHRRGIGSFCLNWAFARCGHLRIDTHGDNLVMQGLLERLGFEKRGIIHVLEDSYPRFAYEKQ